MNKRDVDLTKQTPVRYHSSFGRREFHKQNDEFLEALQREGVSIVKMERTLFGETLRDRYFFPDGEVYDLSNDGIQASWKRIH